MSLLHHYDTQDRPTSIKALLYVLGAMNISHFNSMQVTHAYTLKGGVVADQECPDLLVLDVVDQFNSNKPESYAVSLSALVVPKPQGPQTHTYIGVDGKDVFEITFWNRTLLESEQFDAPWTRTPLLP